MTDLIALLENCRNWIAEDVDPEDSPFLDRLDAAIAELREQKPVAWIDPIDLEELGAVNTSCMVHDHVDLGRFLRPLYLAPVAPVEPQAGLCVCGKVLAPTNAPVEPLREQLKWLREAEKSPEFAQQSAELDNPVSDDARDAARYRWLRDADVETWEQLANLTQPALDAAIDAAMRGKGDGE